MTGKPKVGDIAPDFTLQAQDGRDVSLHEFKGSKNVVLYFYPKDFTMGCTAEAKSFSLNYDKLVEMGAEVIGVSSDTTDSHTNFANECGVQFLLVSDSGGRVRELYGVQSSLGLVPGRTTFVIDKQGVVRHIFSSQLNPKKHITEAMDTLKLLN